MPWVASRALLVFISLQSPPVTAFLKTNAALNSGCARADSENSRGVVPFARRGGGESVGNWLHRCRLTAAVTANRLGDQKAELRPSSL